jgi:hypothetical protein
MFNKRYVAYLGNTMITLLLIFSCTSACYADNGIKILGTPKIWDKGAHNAFTSMIRHQNRWWCVFREGASHTAPDGVLRIITSTDGSKWESAAKLYLNNIDLRDPKITVTPDGRFMLNAFGQQTATNKFQSYVWFSKDGRDWTNAIPIADQNYVLWRVAWYKNVCYGIAFDATSRKDKDIRLYRSPDGQHFETLVRNLYNSGNPTENSMVFLSDGTAICLLRRDPGNAMLGSSKPPYTQWSWKDAGMRIGGPQMIVLPDGRILACVRLSDGRIRTSLCWVDSQSGLIKEFLTLPSYGDTSYAGLVWHDGLLWISYHSQYEKKVSIYLAKVKIPL